MTTDQHYVDIISTMGNKQMFGDRIAGRSYEMSQIDNPNKGDIVLFGGKMCLVVKANSTQSLSVVELPIENGKYICPSAEPIYNGIREVLSSNPGGYGTSEELLIWRHPYDYLAEPILRCCVTLTWDQYKHWFLKRWPFFQSNIDRLTRDGIYPPTFNDFPE